MPSLERPPGACILNKVRYQETQLESMQVLVFRGNTSEDNYPYQNTRDFMGVLYESSSFCNPPLSFMMYQENKQREKNAEHLKNLLQKNLINGNMFENAN